MTPEERDATVTVTWTCDACAHQFPATINEVKAATKRHAEEDGRYCPSPGACGAEQSREDG